jgi:hypothetical protein
MEILAQSLGHEVMWPLGGWVRQRGLLLSPLSVLQLIAVLQLMFDGRRGSVERIPTAAGLKNALLTLPPYLTRHKRNTPFD